MQVYRSMDGSAHRGEVVHFARIAEIKFGIRSWDGYAALWLLLAFLLKRTIPAACRFFRKISRFLDVLEPYPEAVSNPKVTATLSLSLSLMRVCVGG